ncbi:MAG: tyrosine-type recombinase/integrase [Clostridia bacterium]|nr:tyrosine-type recombinase/integrase [Clostridia bacterium]
MQSLPEVLSTFAAYKGSIQNCSPLTVSEYINDLVLFFRFIILSREGRAPGKDEDLSEVSLAPLDYALAESVRTEEIYAFMLYLSEKRGNKVRIRARRLSAIKAFYKYHTVKTRRFAENPAKDIDSPTVKPALPKYLTLEESLKLLESIPKDGGNYQRDYCIITMFLNCGMRLAELVGIDLSDISGDYKQLVVTGKGDKTRMIYLNAAVRDALRDYLAVRQINATAHGKPIIDRNALFLSSRNTRISRESVQKIVYNALKLAGLDGRGISVHKLRHTAATLMYREGNVDVRTLMDVLGHAQLTTTQIYTHVSDKQLEAAAEANPLADIKKK